MVISRLATARRDRTHRWALAWLGLIGLSAFGSNSDAADHAFRQGRPSPLTVQWVYEAGWPVLEIESGGLMGQGG